MNLDRRHTGATGSVLVVSLCVASILAVTLASYLLWMQNQNSLTYQSQAWNHALTIAEAGIEEALAQINLKFGSNYSAYMSSEWPGSSGSYGPKIGKLAENSYYSVVIIPGAPGPTIVSTGYTHVPFIGRQVSRTVRVTTKSAPAFAMAMAALDNISFKGNNIAVDSFDSGDPAHSTPDGRYDPATRKAGGDVASSFGVVNVGNANVNGKIRIGPGDGSGFELGPLGFAGDIDWTGPGIQPGWLANDFNLDFPDVTPPNTAGWLPPLGPIGTNKFVLGAGGYLINGDLRLDVGEAMLVSGNATLFVSGNVDMKGLGVTASQIKITPGSSLHIYVAGASSTFAAVNTLGNASTFQYYGLPSNTSVTWNGNAAYTGTVYAPSAVFTLAGSGDPKNPTDYQGACVVKSVVMDGHFKFHYDENLARSGPPALFKVISWAEL